MPLPKLSRVVARATTTVAPPVMRQTVSRPAMRVLMTPEQKAMQDRFQATPPKFQCHTSEQSQRGKTPMGEMERRFLQLPLK